jgi:hypothetical protein
MNIDQFVIDKIFSLDILLLFGKQPKKVVSNRPKEINPCKNR